MTGDEAAFAHIVATYQDRLIGLLTNLIGDRATAEDTAQETFLRIYRARAGYEAKCQVLDLAVQQRSQSGQQRPPHTRTPQGDPARSGSRCLGPVPQDQLSAEKSALQPSRVMAKTELLEKGSGGHGDAQRSPADAQLLHRFEGMSYVDIGAAMEMSPQAVKSLLSRPAISCESPWRSM